MGRKPVKKGGESEPVAEAETNNTGFWSNLKGLFGRKTDDKPIAENPVEPSSEEKPVEPSSEEKVTESSPGIFDKMKGWFQSSPEVKTGGKRKNKKTKSKLRRRASKTKRIY
jgi:hypothetical protein